MSLPASLLDRGLIDYLSSRPDELNAGAASYADVIPEGALVPVRAEARAAFNWGDEFTLTEFELDVDGQEMRSPLRVWNSRGDKCLRELHAHPDLTAAATALMGRPMEPSEAGYLYYRTGDLIGIHRDLPSCQLVMLVSLFAEGPPLVVYPELMDTPKEALLRLARESDGAPSGGRELDIAAGGLLALNGIAAPHQTPRATADSVAGLATLCFRERTSS